MRILVVEDEGSLREGLVDLLTAAGHEVEAVADGVSALTTGSESAFDLVLLDLMLPEMNGIEVCRRLRQVRPAIPVLMLTARGSEEDKVIGLQAGADDYVTKPFGARELLARVEAVSRRAAAAPAEAEIIEVEGCLLDLGHHTASRGGLAVNLTPREVGILRWVHRHRHRAISRSELLQRVWGACAELETRTVDMAVAKLRQKIEENPANPRIVVTVTGVGYAWGPEVPTSDTEP